MHWALTLDGQELICLETGARIKKTGVSGAQWEMCNPAGDLLGHGLQATYNQVLERLRKDGALIG